MGGVVHGAALAKPTVWPARVVVDPVIFGDDTRAHARPELFAIQAVVAEATMDVELCLSECQGRSCDPARRRNKTIPAAHHSPSAALAGLVRDHVVLTGG